MQTIKLADIRIDGGTQSRACINEQAVADYAEAMQSGAEFPPVVAFFDGAAYWLADGFHRYQACKRAGLTSIAADIRQGTQRDAILYSVGANASHGLRRTSGDKKRAVLVLLNDPEWSKWSDREIARACSVSPDTVGRHRRTDSVTVRSDSERTYTTKHGTQAVMQTANIGSAQRVERAVTEPSPEPPPRPDLRIVETPTEGPETADPERRKLERLTNDALIDEVLGLRADLADAKTLAKKQAEEIKALKEQIKGFEGEQADTIRRQAQIIRHKESEMYRANEKADRALARAKHLEKRVAELESLGIAV